MIAEDPRFGAGEDGKDTWEDEETGDLGSWFTGKLSRAAFDGSTDGTAAGAGTGMGAGAASSRVIKATGKIPGGVGFSRRWPLYQPRDSLETNTLSPAFHSRQYKYRSRDKHFLGKERGIP